MRKIQMLIVAAVVAVSSAAMAQERPNMPSIVIKQGLAQTKKMAISQNERAYWECVLDHLQGTQSDEAVNIILAACRALYGSVQPE